MSNYHDNHSAVDQLNQIGHNLKTILLKLLLVVLLGILNIWLASQYAFQLAVPYNHDTGRTAGYWFDMMAVLLATPIGYYAMYLNRFSLYDFKNALPQMQLRVHQRFLEWEAHWANLLMGVMLIANGIGLFSLNSLYHNDSRIYMIQFLLLTYAPMLSMIPGEKALGHDDLIANGNLSAKSSWYFGAAILLSFAVLEIQQWTM